MVQGTQYKNLLSRFTDLLSRFIVCVKMLAVSASMSIGANEIWWASQSLGSGPGNVGSSIHHFPYKHFIKKRKKRTQCSFYLRGSSQQPGNLCRHPTKMETSRKYLMKNQTSQDKENSIRWTDWLKSKTIKPGASRTNPRNWHVTLRTNLVFWWAF